MYKDKDKQREAVKAATRRYRGKKGDSALSGPKAVSQNAPESSVVDEVGDTDLVIPKKDIKCITIGDQARSMKTMAMLHSDACKRGKDIKVFEDLPPDVQQTIEQMSVVDGKTDNTVKARRTAIAINYQHQFPDQRWPHNELRLTPVGRVGDTVSEWEAANKKA